MPNFTQIPEECDAASCSREPRYEVAYTEVSPHNYRWLCGEHKNMERIHDPFDTKVLTEPWEIDDES